MYPLIELWLSSDRTQRSICEDYQIKPHTFSYWRNKYEKEVADNSEEDTANSLVPVEVKGDESKESGYYAEITYKDGTIVRFDQAVGPGLLQQLLPVDATL